MFERLLIANRGEIACRIMRTARRLGIRCIAVYSEADAGALHVELADEAWPIGPAPAADSYLSIERIIEAARRSGAQAIHPGYGFLSENADFAEACAAAGIVFVGPPPAAIRSMGSKSAAKDLMQRAGVPVVPGYHGPAQSSGELTKQANRIGYPVLIKAVFGGGGKGMRVVGEAASFAAALASAQREARSAFGDDAVLLERYLTRPRHIEVQVFADAQDNVVSLFERDCSIQRRHQKIIEEAPAPGLDEERRRAMGAAACAAARAVGYRGAGTVEFIAEGDAFYFMEMNTRLQVEHAVTEMTTGQDLVEWQLLVAAGAPLPLRQDELAVHGHAIEARLYAEDPARDFAPSTGRLLHLSLPEQDRHLRIDSGVRAGDAITVHYDPMLAKLIVWDGDRDAALRRLDRALGECQIVGIATNLRFLGQLVAVPEYRDGAVDTGFVGRHGAALVAPTGPADRAVLTAAALRVLDDRARAAGALGAAAADPWSPWLAQDGWRPNGRSAQEILLRDDAAVVTLRVTCAGSAGYEIALPDGRARLAGQVDTEGGVELFLDGVKSRARVVRSGALLFVLRDGAQWRLELVDPLAPPPSEAAAGGRLTAPMPGRITRVLVEPGAAVARGAPLVVLEAMKMEHTVTAPADGIVEAVRYAEGELVEEGAELVRLAPAAA